MGDFLAMVLGTALDPILIIFGVFIGWASRKWWHVLLGAVAGGLAYEFLGRWAMGIHGIPLVDILAIGLWISFAFLFETHRRRKKLEKSNLENQK